MEMLFKMCDLGNKKPFELPSTLSSTPFTEQMLQNAPFDEDK